MDADEGWNTLAGHCYGCIHREIQAGLFTHRTSPVPCGAWTVIGVSALPGYKKVKLVVVLEVK